MVYWRDNPARAAVPAGADHGATDESMADKNTNEVNTHGDQPLDEQHLQTVNTDYMKEQIKQRPVNKRKLLRRTIITFCLAVLFGAVACIVFLLVEPIMNRMLNPQEETAPVTFEEESVMDEMSPEDMIANDAEIVQHEVDQQTQTNQELADEIKSNVLDELTGTDIYAQNYTALASLASELSTSMVTVTGVTSDYDWVGDAFEDSSDKKSGMIIADTETQYYIFVDGDGLAAADEIRVTFATSEVTTAEIKSTDRITGAVLLSVSKSDLTDDTTSTVGPVTLGSSARADLLGQPVIAVGAPSGTPGSVSYGVVTNAAISIDVTDSAYNRVTTDIYGSTQATGALADLKGRIIGWITMDYNGSDSANLISAVGITEMKTLFEKMSNEDTISYLGIHATTVTEAVQEEQGVPLGVYVTRVELDSPALDAGIQSGDIITGVYGNEIATVADLVVQMQSTSPGRNVRITVQRQTGGGYEQMMLNAVVGTRLQ